MSLSRENAPQFAFNQQLSFLSTMFESNMSKIISLSQASTLLEFLRPQEALKEYFDFENPEAFHALSQLTEGEKKFAYKSIFAKHYTETIDFLTRVGVPKKLDHSNHLACDSTSCIL